MAVLMGVLAFPYRPLIKGCHSIHRRGEVRKVMNEYWKLTGSNFHVRGPLTICKVEEQLFGTPWDSEATRRTYGSTERGKVWGTIESKYKEGDELYFFTSDQRSWAELRGMRGYALIRKDQVVDLMVTFLNCNAQGGKSTRVLRLQAVLAFSGGMR